MVSRREILAGTRCQIGFYSFPSTTNMHNLLDKWEVLLYRHCDGYPEGILPDILPILADFHKNRGLSDWEYASAWLCSKLKTDYLGIGICNQFHGDIEYYYAIFPNGIIQVYDVRNGWEEIFECRVKDSIKKVMAKFERVSNSTTS